MVHLVDLKAWMAKFEQRIDVLLEEAWNLPESECARGLRSYLSGLLTFTVQNQNEHCADFARADTLGFFSSDWAWSETFDKTNSLECCLHALEVLKEMIEERFVQHLDGHKAVEKFIDRIKAMLQ
jgi:hypothetical protein